MAQGTNCHESVSPMEKSRAMLGTRVIKQSRDNLRRTWAMTPGGRLSTPIKILFVIDGRIKLNRNSNDFGLGYVLDTLTADFSEWVHFEVDVAKRDGAFDDESDLGSYQLKYTSFKFTNAGFNIDSYDQVWFFGDNPHRNDGADGTTDDEILPFLLEPAELKLVAEWMDRGGGVFAAGDHSILGAGMCSKIPRVRTMRKWTHAQGVPTRDGPSRHQTLQPNPDIQDPFLLEGDTRLQPIDLVYRRATGAFPFLHPLVPHPLLVSTQGVIDQFPDHMHEGEVIQDKDVKLDQPLDIPNYDHPEYPNVPVVVAQKRPRPQVIAYANTTNDDTVFDPGAIARLSPLFSTRRFGLVGVYDGDSVGLGRVVVDSTWHHWFSLNLFEISLLHMPSYEKMQAYYRNVGLWLGKPAQRRSMLTSGIWSVLVGSSPMAFSTNDSPWQIGERVLATLGQTVSQCMLGEFVAPFIDPKVLALSEARNELNQSEPSWWGLPDDLLNRALVGGIGSALLGLALNCRETRARGQRPRVNSEAIRQCAVDGASRGQALLKKSIDDAVRAIGALHATLAVSAMPPSDVLIPIEVRRLRVVAETIQLPEPTDPALIGGHITLTIRISLDDFIVAQHILEGVELPAFDARGSVIELGCDVGKVEVHAGESLSIEVLVGRWTSEQANPDIIRFKDSLCGDASSWIGKHLPVRTQAWRLWYRIEELNEGPEAVRRVPVRGSGFDRSISSEAHTTPKGGVR